MRSTPLPADEAERLVCLRTLAILDTPPDAAFDAITRATAQHLQCPIALVSLVDERRQWSKSRHGLAVTETPREMAFCAHAILGDDTFVIPDAQADARFRDNPLVTGEPHVRFYAGQPLRVEGRALGTLCVIDRQPRDWTPAQAGFLRAMAEAAQSLLTRDMAWRRSAIREARLADFARASSDFLWECDASLTLRWISHSADAAANHPAAGKVGQRLWDGTLLDPLGQPDPRGLTLHAAMRSGQEFHRRTLETTGPRGPQVLSVSAVPVLDADASVLGWRGSVREVSAHVLALRQLRAQDERLQRIAAHVPGVLYEYERGSDGRGHFPYASAGVQELLGVLPRQLSDAGDGWLLGVHEADRARVAERLDESAHGLVAWREEFRVVLPQRGVRWLESHATPRRGSEGRVVWHGFLADVTERRAVQAELTDVRGRLQLALASARMGLLRIEPEAGLVTADAPARTLHGVAAGDTDVPLAQWLEALSPGDRSRLLEAVTDVVRFGTSDRLVLATANEAGRLIELMLSPAEGTNEVIGVCRDASEQARAEQALKSAAEAERRRRDYSEFLSRVSHELRTPLNAVLGFTQLLLQEAAPGLPPHQANWLDQIRRGGQYLLSLIEDVLSLTRTDAGHHRLDPKPTSIHAALRDATELLAPLASAVEVVFELPAPDSSAVVLVDRRALRQVLVNVLGNAVKYNRRGGHVRIEAVTGEGQCRVAICDEGRGIEAAALARLFVPFERLGAEHGPVPGTGLGLAIARRLVEGSGGWIDAESLPGRGLCLRFGLPLAGGGETEPVDSGYAELVPGGASSGARNQDPQGRAVFVEDNEVNLQLMEAIFQRQRGWHLDLHADATLALRAVLAAPPELLLLDLNMPGLSGMAFVRAVREEPRCRRVVCVAVTADATEGTRVDALAAGFDDLWTKPVDPQRVGRCLDSLASLLPDRPAMG
jgi:PAS domain S-box-containing protein